MMNKSANTPSDTQMRNAIRLCLQLAISSGDPKRMALAAADSIGGWSTRTLRRLDARTPKQVLRDVALNIRPNLRDVWVEIVRKYFRVDDPAQQIVALCQRAITETLGTVNVAFANLDSATGTEHEGAARALLGEAVSHFALVGVVLEQACGNPKRVPVIFDLI
jgi:hypothetical protein